MGYFSEWTDEKLLGYLEGQNEAILAGAPETNKYSAARAEAEIRGLIKSPVLSQSQVIALVKRAAQCTGAKEISQIQVALSNSLKEAGHKYEPVGLLFDLLFTEARRDKALIGLIPFFVMVCTKTSSSIFGDVDWDAITLTDEERKV